MTVEDRRKRVQRLKKIILIIVVTLLVLPSLFCVVLAVKIGNLEKQIRELKAHGTKSLEIVWNEESLVDVKQAEGSHDADSSEDVVALGETEEESQIETEQEAESEVRKVYLTFDDGPSMYTEEILDILKRYNVKATFFVTGMHLPKYEENFQKILDEGHTLGIHTYSHVYQDIYKSMEAFQDDYTKLSDYIFELTGEETKIYRFPGGSSNDYVSEETRKQILGWLKEEGIMYFDWNVSSEDAGTVPLSAQQIANNCINGVKKCRTAIVLLHDSGAKKSTIEALPLIIEGINRLGDTIWLPIDEETVAIQQIRLTEE